MMFHGKNVCDETGIRDHRFGTEAAVTGRGSEKREGGVEAYR